MYYRIIKAFKIIVILASVATILGSGYYIIRESNLEIAQRLNPIKEVGGNTDFQINIPKIELEKKVIPNIDPRDEAIYKEAFKQGVAHGLGTKFPDEIGNTYLYAHSTKKVENIDKYAGWFTRLDELEVGDEVIIEYGQNKYTYSIASREIIDPRATGVYTAYAPVQMLTLQTCHPRGEVTERIIFKGLLIKTTPLVKNTQTHLLKGTFVSFELQSDPSIFTAFFRLGNRERSNYS